MDGVPRLGVRVLKLGLQAIYRYVTSPLYARSWDATPAIVAKYALFSGPILSHKVESQPQSASDQCENEHKI